MITYKTFNLYVKNKYIQNIILLKTINESKYFNLYYFYKLMFLQSLYVNAEVIRGLSDKQKSKWKYFKRLENTLSGKT